MANQFVVLQIKSRAKILKKWYGVSIIEETVLLDVYNEFATGYLDHGEKLNDEYHTVTTTVSIGSTATGPFIDVQPDLQLRDVRPLGIYVLFDVQKASDVDTRNEQQSNLASDAFSLLMNTARKNEKYLPEPLNENDGLNKLKNKFREFLEKNKVGWSQGGTKTYGTPLIKTVSDCMWYLDGHHETLKSRSCQVPVELQHLQGYNCPERHGHKRKAETPLKHDKLEVHVQALRNAVSNVYMKSESWKGIRIVVKNLEKQLSKYLEYLAKKTDEVQQGHSRTSISTEDDSMDVLPAKLTLNSTLKSMYSRLSEALARADENEVLSVDDFTPTDRRRRHEFLKNLVVPYRTVIYKHSSGKTNVHFMWKVSTDASVTEVLNLSVNVRDKLRLTLPKYHTRAMRREFISSFGRVTGTKPAVLREAYRRLTGDASAASSQTEQNVDERLREILDSEDPDLIWDLRLNNEGRPEKYSEFLEACKTFIDNKVETAADERRHDNVTNDADGNTTTVSHLAMAISAPDLHRQISATLPEGVPIPSVQWLRLQFWPRNTSHATSKYHTGRLKLKFMIQARQFREWHVDCHYASALFRYEKEFAIKYKEYVDFVAMDDKHTCKVGEPNFPVAAVERGKEVIVARSQSFQVADHDFTKVSVTPSVTMVINIPDDIEGSFYDGQIHVGVKENCFQPSSPFRHMTELSKILEKDEEKKEILVLYTDGGPDHRLTYLSVQMSLICLFLKLDKDMLIAVRTPPKNSWKNPVERVMSILNQGLQCIGLMRQKCAENIEEELKSASTMKEIRALAENDPEIKTALLNSVAPVKDLMNEIFQRLNLKGQFFKTFDDAPDDEIINLFSELMKIDDTVSMSDTTQDKIKDKAAFIQFLKTHCLQRQYMFSVKKCDDVSCLVCLPPRLSNEVFSTLSHLPDPVPNGDHFQSFEELYGSVTAESHLPSLREKEAKGHKIPFIPSAQTAKNTGMFVICEECTKPRLLHSQRKLKANDVIRLESVFEDVRYSCGADVHNIDANENDSLILEKVFVKLNHTCKSLVEIPYYSVGAYEIICIHCGSDEGVREDPHLYPICSKCVENKKQPKKKPTRKFAAKD